MQTVKRLTDDWQLATEIHKMEARIWRKTRRDDLKVVMLTSAVRGEGKSTTVAYLATALGMHADRKVLAVDLDFRSPKLNTHFKLDGQHGFGSVLKGECALHDAIIKTELPSLDVILPSSDGEDPKLLLRGPVFADIFEELRGNYDLILMDVPALLPVADASSLINFADGVILLGMAGKTTKAQLKRAREICLGMEANILGLIIGNMQESASGYGQYGYGYYS